MSALRPAAGWAVAADGCARRGCSTGAAEAFNDETVPLLRAKIVAGAANNQLAHPGVEKLLADRDVLYAPDYVVNSGGVIQVADEIEGFNFARAKERAGRIFWLNPEPKLYWNYGDSVMAAYEPFCDGAFECWTTRHLENFVNVVAGGVRTE